jgi:hypothetical protein
MYCSSSGSSGITLGLGSSILNMETLLDDVGHEEAVESEVGVELDVDVGVISGLPPLVVL